MEHSLRRVFQAKEYSRPKLRVLKQVCVAPVQRTERTSYWNAVSKVREEVGKQGRAAGKRWSFKAKFRPSSLPCTTPPGKSFYSLVQSIHRIDSWVCQLPLLCVTEISFQSGDPEETTWIPSSFCHQASAQALYLLSVSGWIGFICEIVKSYPLGGKNSMCNGKPVQNFKQLKICLN